MCYLCIRIWQGSKSVGIFPNNKQIILIMGKMDKLRAADAAFSVAVTNLQECFAETMLNAVPFNEEDKFIFFNEGGMDYSELPEILLEDGTSNVCVGLQRDGNILYILFGDGEDEWDTYEYEPEDISVGGLREIIYLMDEWFTHNEGK